MATPVVIRVIYSDLSEWQGSSAEWKDSPDKGILVAVVFLNPPYKIRLEGWKEYGCFETEGSVHVGMRSFDPPDAWLYHIDKASLRDTGGVIPLENYPTCLVNRPGKFVADSVFAEAQARSLTWEHPA